MAKPTPGVLASFEHIDAAIESIEAVKARGLQPSKDFTVYYSHPNHELDDAVGHPTSPVRRVTLTLGLTGTTAAFSMTIWMNRDWPVLVGGKPIVALPAFVVPGFELTVLLASLSSVAAVIIFSKLFAQKGAAYDGRFSDDRIGLFVAADAAQQESFVQLFKDKGAVEVERVA
jgi:hypothetical protein